MSSLSKLFRIWLLLRGIVLWSIRVKTNGLTSNNNRLDMQKIQHMIWQWFLGYHRHVWLSLAKKKGTRILPTRAHLGVNVGDGTNFFTTEAKSELRIGISKHLMLAKSTILRMYTNRGVP